MSLEDKIQGLTDAVRALTAALAHPYPTVKDVTHNPALAKAEVVPPKPTTTPETIPTVSTTITPAGSSNVIDYAQVAKAITDTFKVDRAKTIEALAKFGAAKGPQLKPVDYAAFLKELTA